MENNTKIGIGVLVLAGVGYYFYNKSKSPISNVSSTTVNEPKKIGFDREKASKELAIIYFPLMVSKQKEPAFRIDEKTGLQTAIPVVKNTITELAIYKIFLGGLNLITDDSDAEFTVNIYKRKAQAGNRDFKLDLNSQIRIDAIQTKYPDALKKLDIG